MTTDFAGKVYDLLVSIGGASETRRDNFIYHHTESDCKEWRFSGKFGFGGKYRSERNSVDCYREDETPQRLRIMRKLNKALSGIEIKK